MTEQCVPNDGLINPAMFPAKSADLNIATITASATAMRSMGQAVEDKTTSVSTTWGRLPSCYRAPEQDSVYAVMRPAVTSADALHTRFDAAARHVDTYAGALEAIKPRLADIERRATEFRNRVIGGVWVDASSAADASFMDHLGGIGDYIPGVTERRVKVSWNEDQDTVDENTRLLREYAQILSDVSAAVATCANAINGLNTNVCTVPVETIPAEAFTSGETPMPWGYAVTENRNCRESVGQGAYTFGKDLLQGAGQLILGYNPANGDWFSGDAYGQAWGGLGDLVGSLLVMASPVGWVAAGMAATGNNDNAFSDWMYDRAVTLRNAGGALVGWDPNAEDGWHAWKEDGVAAGTGAVLSIGTFFIPGAGQVGAGLKAGSIGARVARISGAVTEFAVQGGSWVVKGGVKVLTGLRTIATRFDLGDFGGGFGPQLAVAGAGAGVRANPFAGLLNAMTDGTRATPGTTPHTPVRDAIFGPRETTPRLDAPRVDTPRADTPPLNRADTPEIPRTERPGGTDTTPVRDPQDTGNGSPVRDPQNTGNGNPVRDPSTGTGTDGTPGRTPDETGNGTDGTPVRDPETGTGPEAAPARPASPHAPEWDGGTIGKRADVSDVPLHQRGDPRFDPAHPHYDATPRGEHGNVGTVSPDVPSRSGDTLSGRLLDPNVIPEALRPYVEAGTVVNDNGVLRLAQEVEVTFVRTDPRHDLVEFERQIDLQRRALNQMSTEEWSHRISSFVDRVNNQGAYRSREATLIADRLVEELGIGRREARRLARAQLSTMDPLHGPDQAAGGNPAQFTGMGESGVNRSIGSQWQTRASVLADKMEQLLDDAGIDPAVWGDIRINVKLTLRDMAPSVGAGGGV